MPRNDTNIGQTTFPARPRLALMLFVGFALVVFALGMARIFLARFSSGEHYPPYSTLRTDPLGAMALYDGLAGVEGVTSSRNFRPLAEIPAKTDTTYIFAGTKRRSSLINDEKSIRELSRLATAGGRVVVCLFPIQSEKTWLDEVEEEESGKGDAEESGGKEQADAGGQETAEAVEKPQKDQITANSDRLAEETEPKPQAPGKKYSGEKVQKKKLLEQDCGEEGCEEKVPALEQVWGVGMDFLENAATTALCAPGFDFGYTSLGWHSGLVFQDLDPKWETVLSVKNKPVCIQRAYGRGSLVLATDSFLLSNESVAQDRVVRYLTWLAKDNKNILFDEAHLGIRKSHGIMILARKHGLLGFFFGLVLVAVLFVWKNALPLVPPPRPESTFNGEISQGKDAARGLVRLLQRNLSKERVLMECVTQWERTLPHRPNKETLGLIEEIQRIARSEAAGKDPEAAYANIARLIQKRTLP